MSPLARHRRRTDEAVAGRAGIAPSGALLECVGQRRTLRELGIPEDVEPVIVRDAIDDAAIDNSPRLPSAAEVAGILAAVRG